MRLFIAGTDEIQPIGSGAEIAAAKDVSIILYRKMSKLAIDVPHSVARRHVAMIAS